MAECVCGWFAGWEVGWNLIVKTISDELDCAELGKREKSIAETYAPDKCIFGFQKQKSCFLL